MPSATITKNPASEPTFVTDLQESGQISVVHFSQYELSQDLLLVAFPSKILLARLGFHVNNYILLFSL